MTTEDAFDALRQLPNETVKAYTAFLDYVNMGTGRSLRKLQAEYQRQTVTKAATKNLNTLKNWSVDYEWQRRIAEYLKELQLRQLEKQRERLENFNENTWQLYESLVMLVQTQIAEYEKQKIAKRVRVPDPRNPGQEIEVVYMKSSLKDLQMIADIVGRAGKDLRAQLGLPQTVDVTSAGDPIVPILFTKMDVDEL